MRAPVRRLALVLVLAPALVLCTFIPVVRRWGDRPESSPAPLVAPWPPRVPALPPIPAEDRAMAAALFYYVESPDEPGCRNLTMFGGVMVAKQVDGDKFVCLDAGRAPPPGACLVHSIGIDSEWSFDRAITQYGCQVHAFDPSMTSYNRTVTEFGARFCKIGLAGRTEVQNNGWHTMTLTDIREKLGHTERDIHSLKVDIEGSEWGWLEQDAASLRGVRQFGMEVHMELSMPQLRRHYAVYWALQEAGFRLIHSNANRMWGRDYEMPGVETKVSKLYELVWMRM